MLKDKRIFVAITIVIFIIFGVLISKISSKSEVTSILLNKHYIKIYEHDSQDLEVEIIPKDMNSEIIWTSDNPSIVSVSSGKIIGNSVGSAKIYAKTKDGEVSDFCIVDVIKKVLEEVRLEKEVINLQVGEDELIKPIIIPEELSSEKLIWTSSNSSVAKVDENGKVTGVNEGIAILTGTLLGNEVTCAILVGKKVNSVTLDKTNIELEIGKTETINISINPENSLKERIIWESSDPNIVEVDGIGNIKAKSVGIATITATTEYSKVTAVCNITVTKTKYEIKYMELNKTVTVYDGDAIGTLPTMTKTGYKLIGWYTSSSGGVKVSSNTIVSGNMILYPHWDTGYVITEDSRYASYQNVISCNTETLKYRIINYQDSDVVLVWVDDAVEQLKQGLATSNASGVTSAENILSSVPKNKALVAVNASLFEYGTPLNGIIFHEGKVIKNKGTNTGSMAITRDGSLIDISRKNLNEMLELGVYNNFTISHTIPPSGNDHTTLTALRTQICQIDKHNFVMISSKSMRTGDAARILNSFASQKCPVIFNLDGGGSRKLYYRTSGGSLIKRFGGSRPIPDMLYFREK